MCSKRAVRLREYMMAQIAEILGPYNMWVTGVNLNRPPTADDAGKHYMANGGPENFAKHWEIIPE